MLGVSTLFYYILLYLQQVFEEMQYSQGLCMELTKRLKEQKSNN